MGLSSSLKFQLVFNGIPGQYIVNLLFDFVNRYPGPCFYCDDGQGAVYFVLADGYIKGFHQITKSLQFGLIHALNGLPAK